LYDDVRGMRERPAISSAVPNAMVTRATYAFDSYDESPVDSRSFAARSNSCLRSIPRS